MSTRLERFIALLTRSLRDDSYLSESFPSSSGKAPTTHPGGIALSDTRILAAGVDGKTAAAPLTSNAFHLGGKSLLMSALSHASARLEVAFDEPTQWIPFAPSHRVRRPDGGTFKQFYLRRLDANTPSTANLFYLVVDQENPGDSLTEEGRFAQVTAAGGLQTTMFATRGSDGTTEQAVICTDEGALVEGGWTGAAYVRKLLSTTGRTLVDPISGQTGVAGGTGVMGATVQRVTLATDDGARTDLDTLAGVVSAARAQVNPIVGQAGVAAGSGAVGATVQRVTQASDSPLVVQGAAATAQAVRTTSGAFVGATANLRLMGFTARETAGAAWEIIIHHGTGAGDPAVAYIGGTGSEKMGDTIGGPTGVACPNGIYLEIVSGTVNVVVFTQVAA